MNIEPVEITISSGYTFTIGNLGKLSNILAYEEGKANLTPTEVGAFQIVNQVTCTNCPNFSVETLLGFDLDDYYRLNDACTAFNHQNGTPMMVGANAIQLIYGLEVNGKIYDMIVLEHKAKAIHQLEAERRNLPTNMRLAFLASFEISQLIQTSTGVTAERSLSIAEMGNLTIIDAVGLLSLTFNRRQAKLSYNPQSKVRDILDSEVIS